MEKLKSFGLSDIEVDNFYNQAKLQLPEISGFRLTTYNPLGRVLFHRTYVKYDFSGITLYASGLTNSTNHIDTISEIRNMIDIDICVIEGLIYQFNRGEDISEALFEFLNRQISDRDFYLIDDYKNDSSYTSQIKNIISITQNPLDTIKFMNKLDVIKPFRLPV